MNRTRSPHNLTRSACTFVSNYEILQNDMKIPRIDGCADFSRLAFLHDSKYKLLQQTMPFPDKRILNIPRKKMNNWNNYVVHSVHSDYLESWRDDCKVPDNWTGPKLKESPQTSEFHALP